MITDQQLGNLADVELKAASDMTDREAEVMANHLVTEIRAKLDLYRRRSGGDRVGLDAAGLATLFEETSAYTGKDGVYKMVAEELATFQGQPFFGAWETPDRPSGVWPRQPRARLDQLDEMATPVDVLCGIKELDEEQPNYLVKAGALAALSQVYTPKKKTVVVQRVGNTWILAGQKYDGDLNMNSQGLQYERLLAGLPQYLDRETAAFANYAYKQVFVVKEAPMPGGERLHIYYHNFLYSAEKNTKGRILVDTSSQPENHKMKRKDNLRRTAIEMWARDQRYIHHTVWDRSEEYKMVRLPVRPLPAAGVEEEEGESFENWIDREEVLEEFTQGFMSLRVQNGNKRVVRPQPLGECATMEDVAREAFDKPDEDVCAEDELALYSERLVTNLKRIGEALNQKEEADGTKDSWHSIAYYIDREKLRQGIADGDFEIFSERSVYRIHRLVQYDRLQMYRELFYPEYVREFNANARAREAKGKGEGKGEGKGKGKGKGEGKGKGQDAHKGGKGFEGNNAHKGNGKDNQARKGGGKDKGKGKA